jgi:(+)-trans-carveol dehydrogenase
MGRMDGKVCLITGAARGQGRAHAVRLAAEGADIVAIDALSPSEWVRYPMPGEEELALTAKLVEDQDRRIIARRADVRSRPEIQAVVDEALAAFGGIDVVVANAGITPPGTSFWQIQQGEWDDVIAVNLTGVLHTVSTVVPSMLERGTGGSIVVISSGAGLKANPNIADYNVSKHGAIALAKTMANELAPHRIRVNVICPGFVGTDMIFNDHVYKLFCPDIENPTRQEAVARYSSMNPLPEPYVEPNDVSNAVLWLASEESRFVTGVVLPVDLGLNNA